MQYMPSFGDFSPPEVLSFSGLGPTDAASTKPGRLEKVRILGQRLVDDLHG